MKDMLNLTYFPFVSIFLSFYDKGILSRTLHRLDEVEDEKEIEIESNQSTCSKNKNQSIMTRGNDEMYI